MRDRYLQIIAEHGSMAWQKVSSYNWRALVDADIKRFKQVIGDGLRSRTDPRRATEVGIAVDALNRMLELGRPDYVRFPQRQDGMPEFRPLADPCNQVEIETSPLQETRMCDNFDA